MQDEHRRDSGLPHLVRKVGRTTDGRFKTPKSWYGTVSSVIDALKLDRFEYDVIYFRLSEFVHSSTSLITKYVATDGTGFVLSFDPFRNHAALVPQSATIWLLQIGRLVTTTLNLGRELGDEIDGALLRLDPDSSFAKQS
ncbi:MAG TPA: hypothetical protein VGI29_06630, partial [Candidatus Binataceae bacterium]